MTKGTGRDAKDYAIEHAEYMAVAIERYIERDGDLFNAKAEGDSEEIADAAISCSEVFISLRSSIHEFRKRKDRAYGE